MRVGDYYEALKLARCAGEDAANRRMRKAGRKAWSSEDYDHCVAECERILKDLGFDTQRWIAMAGVPRNEPELPARKKTSRRSKQHVQLSFAFA